MSSKIYVIKNTTLEEVFNMKTREYVVGGFDNHYFPDMYNDNNIEIGINKYTSYTTELPHFHTTVTEYEYVIAGETKYKDLDSGEVFCLPKGSFFIIPPRTKYAQKSLPSTEIIFIKYPSGGDKQIISVDEELADWYSCWNK